MSKWQLGRYKALGNSLFSTHFVAPRALLGLCRPEVRLSSSVGAASEQRFFPRRALMYVPACDERKTLKAASLKVDSIVFDIEDGVAANQKVLGKAVS